MFIVTFLQSMPGRLLRVTLGGWLIAYGVTHESLFGLVLMMAGMVPAVTALAGICLIEEVIKSRRASHVPAARARAERAARDIHLDGRGVVPTHGQVER